MDSRMAIGGMLLSFNPIGIDQELTYLFANLRQVVPFLLLIGSMGENL